MADQIAEKAFRPWKAPDKGTLFVYKCRIFQLIPVALDQDSLQTDRVKNEFRPKLRGMTVWALYLNTKQHSRGHNFQPAGKEANLPISY